MEHDGCKLCKYEHVSEIGTHCQGCKQNAVDKYIRITNADRIRSFSDEQLAEFLSKFDACDYCKESVRDVCTVFDCDNIRKSELIKFLQSEVEE